MKRITAMIACLLAATLLISTIGPAAFAQQSSDGWANVQALSGDVDLSVKLKEGKTLRGEFSSVNDSELTILRKGKQQVIAKNTIAEIHRLDRKAEKGKYAAIGAAIGTGTGLAIGAGKASSGRDDYEIFYAIGPIMGAGIGALGGLAFGAAKRKHVLIYQAR
jgi:hypothetical protein